MSIASEITRINTNIANSYTAVDNKNGTLPQVQNSANLASAIDSIEVIEQATAEGESLSLTNTKAMPYSDYVVEGKSEQDGEPSPSNPSEIHSVADDVNLFEINEAIAKTNVTISENGIFTNTNQINSITKIRCQLFQDNTYIEDVPQIDISLGKKEISFTKNSSFNKIAFGIKSSPLDVLVGYDVSNFENGQVYTISLNIETLTSTSVSFNNVKIQKGSVSTPYSPYNQGTVTIKQRGKNLVNVTATSKTTGGITFTVNSDKSIKLNGTNTSGGTLFYRLSDNFTLPAGTYTLSNHNDNCNPSSTYGFYDDGNNFDRTKTSTKTFSGTVTIKPYIRIDAGISINNQIIYPMIEQNSTATDYEPYFSKDYTIQTEPLRSLPNGVKDTIEADGIHHLCEQVDMSNLNFQHNGSFWYTNDLANLIKKPLSNSVVANALAEKYICTYADSNHFLQVENGFAVLTSGQIRLNGPAETTPTGILQYELAEEVIEPLTQNQATTMLDIIKTGSYEGTTNIYTDEDVKPTMKVGYYKKS